MDLKCNAPKSKSFLPLINEPEKGLKFEIDPEFEQKNERSKCEMAVCGPKN